MQSITDTILRIEQEKTNAKIVPSHATLVELLREHTSEQIRAEVLAGTIGYGRTINSYYFYVKNR